MQKKREKWIDIAKGIGIILVVIGHSGNQFAHHYFFWFHMPLFFLLSGYTFKSDINKNQFWVWAKRRFFQLLIPYFSFGIFIIILISSKNMLNGKLELIDIFRDFLRLVFGGQTLKGAFAVFWFITCLLVTQVLFAILTIFVKSIKTQIIIIFAAFIFGHFEGKFIIQSQVPIPWSVDVVLISTGYFAVGFYLKKFINFPFKFRYSAIILVLSIILNFVEYFGFYSYHLDMKYHQYTNLFLDLIIPINMSLTICILSYWISKLPKVKIIEYLGVSSLPIMYLHIPINIIFGKIIGEYNWIYFSVIGLTIPLFINLLIIKRFAFSRILLLGEIKPNNKIKVNV
ncbi:MAG: acyltransferase family protein [Bacillus sp. (in: firmicutes)]